MTPTLFGLLIIERDPYVLADFLGLFQAWLQDAGGFAALGLFAYILYALTIPAEQAESAKSRASVSPFMLVMAVASLLLYVAYLLLLLGGKGMDVVNYRPVVDNMTFVKAVAPKFSTNLQPLALMLGGLCALLGVGQPFAANVLKMRWRRIGALAKLGFKEASRSRLYWVFLLFLLPYLFPAKWYFLYKAENELRSTVSISAYAMNFFLLVPAALLAAFSIPRDIRDQNIYTIVTKPVERFEIVFGRFLGYTGMLTVVLLLMTAVGWLYIYTTGVSEEAKAETYKARVPVRGKLAFASRKADFAGTNVGREFDYRKYVAGDPSSPQRALWAFDRIPTAFVSGDRTFVPLEFTFDIFRMTKGVENRGVDLTIRVTTAAARQVPPSEQGVGSWHWADEERGRQYAEAARAAVRQLQGLSATADVNPEAVFRFAEPGSKEWDALNKLTEEFGYYEIAGKEIFDYHPESVNLPVGLFKNAAKSEAQVQAGVPALTVSVKCQTGGQMLGVAEGDLYLMEGQRLFAENYFKASFGVWCRMVTLVGVAIVLSTYLSGVIAFLGAAVVFACGYFSDHIADIASGSSFAGGPFRAVNSLLKAEQPTAQLAEGDSVTRLLEGGDVFVSWIIRRFVNMVPDLDSYAWTEYLAEGFSVPLECLFMNLLVVVGYLLPWFVLSFYLMRSREVAA
jgi:ABC-type transport system involved in multi-copper enzyme maturation permease subunit